MLSEKFGIEIEFTGITREQTAKILSEHFGETANHTGGCYDEYQVKDTQNRTWKIVRDSSIRVWRKGENNTATDLYSVELVSPILEYETDIESLQEIIRKIRKNGGITNDSTGIHIHLNGENHTPRSIKNFINIIASKNDLLYKSLQIKHERMKYCKKIDQKLVEKIKKQKPTTMEKIKQIWYSGYCGSPQWHYHESRYHFLNLHSFWTRNRTVELRGFNSELHAGKIRSYIVLALALNHQALTQNSASSRKNQVENEKFAMRTYLNRIGFIGEKYKNCREHLCKHLSGSAAWRFGNNEGN